MLCEIVYFFELDVCSKPIFCPKIAHKGKTCSRLILSAKSNCKTPNVAKNWPGLRVWAIIGSSPAFPGPFTCLICSSRTAVSNDSRVPVGNFRQENFIQRRRNINKYVASCRIYSISCRIPKMIVTS